MTPMDTPPAAQATPVLPSDLPPDPSLKEQVVRNQARTAIQWSDTTADLAVNNIINERDQIQETRWHILVMGLLAILLAIYGSWWTYNSLINDRALAAQRSAASERPYQPQSVTPVR